MFAVVHSEIPEEKDYRWALHLGWFHEKDYMFHDRALSSHIKLTSGIFYAEKLSGPAKIRLSRLTGEKPIPLTGKAIDAGITYRPNWRAGLEIHYIAQEIGAKIYFGAKDSEFRLECSSKGKPIPSLPLKLRKPPAECYYAVIFNNDCRFRNEEDGEEKCTVTVNGKEYGGDECKSDLPLYHNKELLLFSLKEEDILDFKPDDNGVDCPCSPDSEPS